jgi:transcription elongation factor GreA
MSQSHRTWLTHSAHDRLRRELAALLMGEAEGADPEFALPAEAGVRQARITRIQEILRDAVVGEIPPDDGIAEPGMVLTVRYAGEDDSETFLLGTRDGSSEDHLAVYSPESPLGRAIAGARQGEERSYTAPTGTTIRVTLLRAEPYGQRTGRPSA